MPLYVKNGRLFHRTTGKKRPESDTLIVCSIPGCVEFLPPGEYEDHLLFHAEPVEEPLETLSADADEEGVYSVTSVGAGEE